MRTIAEPDRQRPMLDDVDVLVVGGGPAGAGAALAAGRLGAKTLIVEQISSLGGVATSWGAQSLFAVRGVGPGGQQLGDLPAESGVRPRAPDWVDADARQREQGAVP